MVWRVKFVVGHSGKDGLICFGFIVDQKVVGYWMPDSFLYILTVLFQTIHVSISTQIECQNSPISSNSV